MAMKKQGKIKIKNHTTIITRMKIKRTRQWYRIVRWKIRCFSLRRHLWARRRRSQTNKKENKRLRKNLHSDTILDLVKKIINICKNGNLIHSLKKNFMFSVHAAHVDCNIKYPKINPNYRMLTRQKENNQKRKTKKNATLTI